ncbi:hypothetical protein LTR78_006962 [Recurvomyces mirabilis]|uniref:Zn(2)-C6 fungal-type domain-containing protein n=1 Tax=Recurvomyces mirabilis TaxID=574656 RepID=A0AAE0WJZ5_9PEZI|nr:hypothetical protein LTR78_006962 [Recurvomyces mirabilis]KAK5153346.1 hypothetical protein LTS14_007515 [Recurvomyces mirabilis]
MWSSDEYKEMAIPEVDFMESLVTSEFSSQLDAALEALESVITLPTMSYRAQRSAKPIGRRPGPKIPCDDCIVKASQRSKKLPNLELCDDCSRGALRPKKHKRLTQRTPHIRTAASPTADDAPAARELWWSSNQLEQHALQFFVSNSAPQLAGYFDSSFWQRTVLQAARHEPAVKHALAAIGALHEKLLLGAIEYDADLQDERAKFALEQCNKSITHLVDPLVADAVPNLKLLLTTCILFTCFEALQGHCEQAILHATQGYGILQQCAASGKEDMKAFAVELEQLTILMRRLQTQSKGLMAKTINIVPDPAAINTRRPTDFESMREAREGLELVLNQLTVYIMDLELDDNYYDMAVSNAEKELLFGPWLADWEKAFSAYLVNHQNEFTPIERKGAMILKAHHVFTEILAELDLSLGELGWDVFLPKFKAIVDLAEAALEDSKIGDLSTIEARWKTSGVFISSPAASLSFTLGIVDPLYEFIIRIEEDGPGTPPKTAADIPVEDRVSSAWFDFSDKSTAEAARGTIAYVKTGSQAKTVMAPHTGVFEQE